MYQKRILPYLSFPLLYHPKLIPLWSVTDRWTDFKTPFTLTSIFFPQADRSFARSRLCTDKDGTTNNLVLYMVRNDTSKKGGDAPWATD